MPRTRAVMIAPTKMTAAKKLMERKSRKIRIIRYVDDSTWSLRYRARTGFRARPHGAYNRFANRSNYGGAPMVLTRTPVTEPVVSIEPAQRAWNYPLF